MTVAQTRITSLSRADLASALGPCAKDATYEQSALDLLGQISLPAIVAVGESMMSAPRTLRICRAFGTTDPEDPNWRQLVLVVDQPGEPGSDEWRASLQIVGHIIEYAIARHPDLSHAIGSEIAFEV